MKSIIHNRKKKTLTASAPTHLSIYTLSEGTFSRTMRKFIWQDICHLQNNRAAIASITAGPHKKIWHSIKIRLPQQKAVHSHKCFQIHS
uniref:Uncharacterized protein n=1 Tax=Anguilla anguilla TaxID=7936 RepID=A0A0E9X783_ANGAN